MPERRIRCGFFVYFYLSCSSSSFSSLRLEHRLRTGRIVFYCCLAKPYLMSLWTKAHVVSGIVLYSMESVWRECMCVCVLGYIKNACYGIRSNRQSESGSCENLIIHTYVNTMATTSTRRIYPFCTVSHGKKWTKPLLRLAIRLWRWWHVTFSFILHSVNCLGCCRWTLL